MDSFDLYNLTEELSKLNIKDKDILLGKFRNEVDKIDAEISSLLIKRINLVIEIGTIKKSLDLSTYDAQREKDIIENILYTNDPRINKALKNIYERIIDESRSIQRERKR